MLKLVSLIFFAVVLIGCDSPVAIGKMATPAGPQSAEANLAHGPDGTVILSWLVDTANGSALRYSVLDGNRWQPAQTISESDNWFVNWADFPSVVPVSTNLWAAHWLVKSSGDTYSYDVVIALSKDRGETWSKAISPHTDGTNTEHGFVSLFPWQDSVGALWLDGRNMVGKDAHSGHGEGGMTLRSAIVSTDQTLSNEQLVDELVCDCCQTDVAQGPEGPIAVYRDRTTDETRDIYVTRAINGRWQKGKPVNHDNWTIAGCPVNGPAISADGKNVVVAWFTAADDKPRVRMARSNDGGKSFAAPIQINARKPLGRVDIELLKNGDAVVSWMERSAPKKAELCIRQVPVKGEPGPVHVVATTTDGRPSGVPQMVRHDQQLLFAWTYASKDRSRVHTARIDTKNLMSPPR